MTSQGRAVWQLLRAHCAWIPGPQTTKVWQQAAPGERPSKRVKCQPCGGDGKRRIRSIVQKCDKCGGLGSVVVDDYTGRRLQAGEEEAHEFSASEMAAWEQQTLRALERVESLLRLHDGIDAKGDSHTHAHERHEKLQGHGSFRELDEALAWLRDENVLAYQLIHAHLIYLPDTGAKKGQKPREPHGQLRVALEAICELLATRMPATIRVPAWMTQGDPRDSKDSLWRGKTDSHLEQRNGRDQEIRDARANGTPVPSIMATFALAKTQVYGILAATSCATGDLQVTL